MSPAVIERLSRNVSYGDERIVAGEDDVSVHERSDRKDGARAWGVYCHSAANDWKAPAHDSTFFVSDLAHGKLKIPGVIAMVRDVLEYAMRTKRLGAWSSGEYLHGGGGPTPHQHWGSDDGGISSIHEHVLYAESTPDDFGRGGLGAREGLGLVAGYSMGGPSALAYANLHPEKIGGIITFSGANALSLIRGTDAAHVRTATTSGAGQTSTITVSGATFTPGMVGTHFVSKQSDVADATHRIVGYTSATVVTVSPAFSPAVGSGIGLYVVPNDLTGGYYTQISQAYTNDSLNPSPGVAPLDAAWATIAAERDAIMFASTIDPKPPVLAFHASDDITVPIAQARAFATAWGADCTFVDVGTSSDGLGHFTQDFGNYPDLIADWIDALPGL